MSLRIHPPHIHIAYIHQIQIKPQKRGSSRQQQLSIAFFFAPHRTNIIAAPPNRLPRELCTRALAASAIAYIELIMVKPSGLRRQESYSFSTTVCVLDGWMDDDDEYAQQQMHGQTWEHDADKSLAHKRRHIHIYIYIRIWSLATLNRAIHLAALLLLCSECQSGVAVMVCVCVRVCVISMRPTTTKRYIPKRFNNHTQFLCRAVHTIYARYIALIASKQNIYSLWLSYTL